MRNNLTHQAHFSLYSTDGEVVMYRLYRRSYISTCFIDFIKQVVKKEIKCEALLSILLLFRNEFNKFGLKTLLQQAYLNKYFNNRASYFFQDSGPK